uniref:Uncharacterized protein n=1 Tax=Trypanosoma congolense (strain IL3000) TaxID=1068625 RepID=G0UY80_TRYCI|nr:conserved hypothetical protein [Trypanosoma congolense IL3000]
MWMRASLTLLQRLPHTRSAPLHQAELISHRRRLRRGSLLVELDCAHANCSVETQRNDIDRRMGSSTCASLESGAIYSGSELEADNRYLVPTPHAKRLKKAVVSVRHSLNFAPKNLCGTADEPSQDPATDAHCGATNESHQPSSLQMLNSQQTALRNMFNDAERHCIRMRKDLKWLKKENRDFTRSHGRPPTYKEVPPHVDVALAPVAALKLTKCLSPHSCSRQLVEHSLLLHQDVVRNKLVQSNQKTLFRCLRCFHVYTARPRTLLRGGAGQSWLEFEEEVERKERLKQLSRSPQLRKKKYSIGRRCAAAADDPQCCPMCESPRAQWAMEYVHYRTHA